MNLIRHNISFRRTMSNKTGSSLGFALHPSTPVGDRIDVVVRINGQDTHLHVDPIASVMDFKVQLEKDLAPLPGLLATISGIEYHIDFAERALDTMGDVLLDWRLSSDYILFFFVISVLFGYASNQIVYRVLGLLLCVVNTRESRKEQHALASLSPCIPTMYLLVEFADAYSARGNPFLDNDNGVQHRHQTLALRMDEHRPIRLAVKRDDISRSSVDTFSVDTGIGCSTILRHIECPDAHLQLSHGVAFNRQLLPRSGPLKQSVDLSGLVTVCLSSSGGLHGEGEKRAHCPRCGVAALKYSIDQNGCCNECALSDQPTNTPSVADQVITLATKFKPADDDLDDLIAAVQAVATNVPDLASLLAFLGDPLSELMVSFEDPDRAMLVSEACHSAYDLQFNTLALLEEPGPDVAGVPNVAAVPEGKR